MRKLFTLCLLVFTLSASAQWQQTGSKVRYVNGLGIPTRDTAAGVAADSSQILIRPADSSLYIKYKRTWVKVGAGGTMGGSGTINRVPKFTASTTIGNSSIVDSASAVAVNIRTNGFVGLNTSYPLNNFVVSNAGASGFEVNPTGGVSSGVLLQAYNRNTSAYMAQSYYALTHTFNTGTAGATRALDISSAGNTLVGTAVDNGVDRLQVSGSMNVSARATAQNLSVVGTTSTTGNIGIFNSAPFYALSVGDGTSTRQVVINGINSGTAGGSSIAVQANSLTTIMFGNKSNIIGGAYDGQPLFGFGGSTNSLQFYNFNTTVTSAMISSGDRFLIGTTTDNGTDRLQVNGSISGIGMKQNYVTKTGTYTATDADYVIDCTSGTFTVTLPASSGRTGRILIIKNSGAGTITVDGNASETIDGAATYSLATQYATVQIMSDGTNWKIIAKF